MVETPHFEQNRSSSSPLSPELTGERSHLDLGREPELNYQGVRPTLEQPGDISCLVQGLGAALHTLLGSANPEQGIPQALEILGLAAEVDRVGVFANCIDPPSGHLAILQQWQWVAPGVAPLESPDLSPSKWFYAPHFSRWYDQLSQQLSIGGSIEDFPPSEQALLASRQIQAILVTPICLKGEFWGFITWEIAPALSQSVRQWSTSEQNALRAFAAGLSAAIAQQQQATELERQVEERTLHLQQRVEELEREATRYEGVERILRQSESRFQKLAANTPGMIHQFRLASDGSMSFPYVSSACWDIFGYQPGEVRRDGRLLTEAVHPQDQEYFLASVHYSAETLRNWEWEGRMLTAQGEVKWIQGSARPERQRDGSIVWDGLLLDISDRKAAEAKIHESYNLLNSVINGTSDHIIVKNTKGQYILVNQALLQTFGISAEAILGKDDWSIFPSSEAQKIRLMDQNIMDSRSSRTFEETIVLKGKTRTFLTTKTPYYDAEGNIAGLIAITRDITERKQAEDELLLFKQAVESSGDAIGIANSKLQHFYQNRAFSEMYECATVEEFNRTFGSITAAYADSKVAEAIVEAISEGRGWIGEVEQRSKTGRLLPILLRANPIYNAKGDIVGAIGSHTDISDRKQAEQALKESEAQLRQQAQDLQRAFEELSQAQSHLVQSEKMSSLGQLVAGIAHEINNPVNFIYGNITPANGYIQDLFQLIALYQEYYPYPAPAIQHQIDEIDLPFLLEDLPNLLKSMQVGAERIEKIVSSLRMFSRMDEAAMKAVDLHEGIDSTLMILQNRLKSNDDRPEVMVVKHYGDLPMVECYAGQLNQVFMNVLVNGIDAIDDKARQTQGFQPQITIRTGLTRSHQVIIRIADNGPGIPDTVKSRVFDPFFTTKPVGKGTGMGLSICYQIITKQHGGTLQCISAPGQGAEFVITIPLQQRESEP